MLPSSLLLLLFKTKHLRIHNILLLTAPVTIFYSTMPTQQPLAKSPEHLTPDQSHALKIHNDAREAASKQHSHPRPQLVWDTHLEAEAMKWAQHLVAQNKGLQHSTGGERPGQGENLYWVSGGGGGNILANASQAWVDESKNYHGEKVGRGNFESYGHYTQVIWPATTKVGVAEATSGDGAKFVVGRYSPQGNFVGQNAWTGT